MTHATAKPVLDLLLVDDDAELRSDIANYFSRQGHRVEQAEVATRDQDESQNDSRQCRDLLAVRPLNSLELGPDVLEELPDPSESALLLAGLRRVATAHSAGTGGRLGRDLVNRLRDCVRFDDRRILYSWIGATRRDWRGQGHFRALTEESEAWAVASGFQEVIVKTKNRFYGMRSTLTQLQFDVIKYERQPQDNSESKVYMSKLLSAELVAGHRSLRSVTQA